MKRIINLRGWLAPLAFILSGAAAAGDVPGNAPILLAQAPAARVPAATLQAELEALIKAAKAPAPAAKA